MGNRLGGVETRNYAERLRFIGNIQYAIRGAAHIYAVERLARGIFTVAAGSEPDGMLDNITDLIEYCGGLSPEYTGVEWGAYLAHTGAKLRSMSDHERRGCIHNALVGMAGSLPSIEGSSRGAVAARRDQAGFWVEINIGVYQTWGDDVSAAPASGLARPALTQRRALLEIAGSELHAGEGLGTPDRALLGDTT